MIKLSVIILCYHGDHWIGPCVESLENQSLERDLYEIILVDNGRSTPSLQNYEGNSNVKVIYFDQNFGFTGGNNKALSYAEADIVILINQDVLVHFHCLKEMLHAFNSRSEAGIISTNMQMANISDQIDLSTSIPNITGLFQITKTGYAAYRLIPSIKKLLPINFVSGNGLGFRKAIIKDVGDYLFDERLGSYAEDLDLSLRLAATSWTMYVCRKAVIYHFRDDSFSGSPIHMLLKFLHISSNRLFVYYKNFQQRNFFFKLPMLIIGVPLKVGRFDGAGRFDYLKFIVGCFFTPLVLMWFFVKTINSKPQ